MPMGGRPTVTYSGQCSHLSCSSAVRGATLTALRQSLAIARSSRITSTSWSGPRTGNTKQVFSARNYLIVDLMTCINMWEKHMMYIAVHMNHRHVTHFSV